MHDRFHRKEEMKVLFTYLPINPRRRDPVTRHEIEHDLHLDRIPVEGLVDLARLNKIAQISEPVRFLGQEGFSDAAVLDSDAAEGDLTQVAFRCVGSTECKQVLTVRPTTSSNPGKDIGKPGEHVNGNREEEEVSKGSNTDQLPQYP